MGKAARVLCITPGEVQESNGIKTLTVGESEDIDQAIGQIES